MFISEFSLECVCGEGGGVSAVRMTIRHKMNLSLPATSGKRKIGETCYRSMVTPTVNLSQLEEESG
jgi:hypothetical protein